MFRGSQGKRLKGYGLGWKWGIGTAQTISSNRPHSQSPINIQTRNRFLIPIYNFIQMHDRNQEEQEFTGKYIDTDRDRKSRKKRPNMTKIVMNVADTQYPVVKFVGKKIMRWNLDYSHVDDFNFDICWTDNAVKPEVLAKMQSHQKINHFPGMSVLSRKNNLGRNLMKMRKVEPEEFGFFPMTFMIPGDYNELKSYHANRKAGKAQTFIVKPEASCQGRGIYLTRNISHIKPTDKCVVQRYLSKPFLLDELKFDLRIYVLITGIDPLRLYVYEEGLVRLATEPYVAPRNDNLEDVCMHLTNYAINKDSPNFVFNESAEEMNVGHKRSLVYLYKLLAEKGYDVEELKGKINDMFIKTFISGHPVLSSTYRSCQQNNFSNDMCFELLGFDVMIDHKLNPVLLQVNYTPSFSTDTPLDALIKKNAIRDTLHMLNINEKNLSQLKAKRDKDVQQRLVTGKRKKYTDEQKNDLMNQAVHDRDEIENRRLGGFKKIYPLNQQQVQKYQKFFNLSYEVSDVVSQKNRSNNFDISKLYFRPKMDQDHKGKLKKDLSMKTTAGLTKKEKGPKRYDQDRKVIFQSVDVDGITRKLARLDSGKSSRKNDSQLRKQLQRDVERSESPGMFTNKNLKQAMTKSKVHKHYRE